MKFNSICIKTAQQMKSPKIWAFLVVLPKKLQNLTAMAAAAAVAESCHQSICQSMPAEH